MRHCVLFWRGIPILPLVTSVSSELSLSTSGLIFHQAGPKCYDQAMFPPCASACDPPTPDLWTPHQTVTTRVQRFWTVSYGERPLPLNDKARQVLHECAAVLRDFKYDSSIFLDQRRFTAVIRLMMTHCGVYRYAQADPKKALRDTFPSTFAILPALVAEKTKCLAHPNGLSDFPEPGQFYINLRKEGLDRARRGSLAPPENSEHHYFRLDEIVWRTGAAVADAAGQYLLRQKQNGSPVGMGHGMSMIR